MKKRCHFGHGHLWIKRPHEPIYDCSKCGLVDYSEAEQLTVTGEAEPYPFEPGPVKTEQDALFSVESIPMVDGQQIL